MNIFEICDQISKKGFLWVQGAGGNVSVKKGNELWIKPSGSRLDEIKSDQDLACVDLSKIKMGLRELAKSPNESGYSELLVQAQVKSSLRPSMETGFHALVPETFVAHFHSLVSVLIVHEFNLSSQKVKDWYSNFWQNYLGELVIFPLVMPGLELSLQLQEIKKNQVVLLQNHGVILQGTGGLELEQFFKMEMDFCRQFNYPEALEMLQGMKEPNLRAPLHFYFPDFAIVFDKLFPFLQEIDGSYEPRDDDDDNDNDNDKGEGEVALPESYLEIWKAHCFLHHVGRNLLELPQDFVQKIVKLPTEIYRKKRELR